MQLRTTISDLDIIDPFSESQDKDTKKHVFHASCLKNELEILHLTAIARLNETKPLISVTFEDKEMEVVQQPNKMPRVKK